MLVGAIYEDPEGKYIVIELNQSFATIMSIQDDPNYGRVYIVPREEAEYFYYGGRW